MRGHLTNVINHKIADATAAETAVRAALESQFAGRLKRISFHKCWYASAGRQEFWDVEGTLVRKRGLVGQEAQDFRYQVDPESGNIIGYEYRRTDQPVRR